ncbi:S-adenosyl-L-methionine-dependent methyltransferase [Cristinia sonorae]|uniref:S-adenosyl-L-methionine-dependent methyltransferase n=1 Tax=Cristinia sonorae TaxID=1940300 RepID=A0A8K0UKC8_9AGAR|nr:S-adenosyl-L-methionine-dependent methyltransferase [Cristinia sonorae]
MISLAYELKGISGWSLIAGGVAVAFLLLISYRVLEPYFKFFWHSFIVPIKAADQRGRLEKFYKGQADAYDTTRKGLLRGRMTMLNLSAAHLREMRAANPGGRLVWVDIGGGTGFNIESMDKFFPISSFDAVYLVDLCEPLLEVARKRFARRGWKNVHVICADAASFILPEPGWVGGREAKGSISFVTLSYSLSMIPNFYPVLDRISHLLHPQHGIFGVVDFYTAGRSSSQTLHERAIGGHGKECGWISRWFWQIWFDFDHVSLGPQRRDYLEYKFGTIKSYNGRNRFVLPFIVRIPYYIWIGRCRTADVSRFVHAFEVEGGNTIGNTTPHALKAIKAQDDLPDFNDLGESALVMSPASNIRDRDAVVIDVSPPLSTFHYAIRNPWRLPYYEQKIHKEFRSFIYAFTWEDPAEDMKHLDLGREDSMFVITSAGDNALHYAIAAQPKRIHCVDVNPCQGHLFELKLAGIQGLIYDEFFSMFGEGRQPNFRHLLDAKLSPLLSSLCYQFWRINSHMFKESFYKSGYSGWALRLAQWIFKLAGVSEDVRLLCEAGSIPEQERIWREAIRPVLLNSVVVALLKNPVFCWNALGVPLNQRKMFLDEGSAYDFVKDTFDPIPSTALLRDGAYHYLLPLLGKYTHNSCPAYLTRQGFDALRANNCEAMDAFRLHTDSIINVLRGLPEAAITRAVIMDHLDWFTEGSPELDDEVANFYRVLSKGGFVLLRSAAKQPWYMQNFSKAGFKVSCISVRQGNKVAIDRVNMYASFWKAEK